MQLESGMLKIALGKDGVSAAYANVLNTTELFI